MSSIYYNGVKTNNLKNINVELVKDSINCLIGPSGSGKSSLAFNTINQLSQNELQRLLGQENVENEYDIDEHGELLVTIPLEQSNYNVNPRSTIATYYEVDKYFKYFFSSYNSLNSEIFSFNKLSSSCSNCRGLGYVYRIDKNKLVNYNEKIKNIPFSNWDTSYSDYYKKLLKEICSDYDISIDKRFSDLSEEKQDFLLYGKSENKYKINYVQGNRKRVKTSYFYGAVSDAKKKLDKNKKKIEKYTKKSTCPTCSGARFSKEILNYQVLGKSIGEVYLMSFNKLIEWLKELKTQDKNLENYVNKLIEFINSIIDLNLGYLNLNRSIPSLSGGEFQRLRLSQIFNSKLKDLLIILDEPLKSLHPKEVTSVEKKLKQLEEENTLIIIEHNLDFINKCKNVIALGAGGGKNGGELINSNKYLDDLKFEGEFQFFERKDEVAISTKKKINNVKPFDIKVPLGTCIGIGGVSGSGKTTFLKNILPEQLYNYTYVSQKPIKGNAYSIIATYINVFDNIRSLFARENDVSKSLFSFHYNGSGGCDVCNGKGKTTAKFKYEENLSYICPECNGRKYKDEVLDYLYYGYNIYEILSLSIDEAINFFEDKNSTVKSKLEIAQDIGLGYLKLDREISTLSGGEAQRIKLLQGIKENSKNKIFGLDEPFKGLNNSEINQIMQVIYDFIEKGNTFFIVEHNMFALNLCSYLIEFGEGGGENGGEIVYNGLKRDIQEQDNSLLKKYI